MDGVIQALRTLKASRDRLTKQQFKTLKGQIIAGDIDGAMKGLKKIKERGRTHGERQDLRHSTGQQPEN